MIGGITRGEGSDSPEAAALRSILDHLPMTVFWKDRDFRLRGYNRRFVEALGFTPFDAALGHCDGDLLGPGPNTDHYRKCDTEVMETGVPMLDIEEVVHGVDGVSRTLLTSKVPMFDADGRVTGLLGVSSDITAQKQMQRDLESLRREADERARTAGEQERVLREVIEAIPQTVFWKDRDSVYRGCNGHFARATGHTDTSKLEGKTDFDLSWSRADAESYRAYDQEVMSAGEPLIDLEETQHKPDGSESTLLTSKVPLRNEEGEVVGILGMHTDITERKQVEAERKELQLQLVVASREAGKSEVATGVLHNVGNAINGIGVSVDLLSGETAGPAMPVLDRLVETLTPHAGDFPAWAASDPRAAALPGLLASIRDSIATDRQQLQDELARLHRQVRHVKEVISSQQTFARSSAALECFNATELADEAMRVASAGHKLVGIQVGYERDGTSADLTLTVDRHVVVQVLVNLIRNACQAMPPETSDGRVKLHIGRGEAPDTVRFEVSDNGRGIDSETMSRLFEHGFTTRSDGHGFGLHTCAIFAEGLGGSLTAHSEGAGHGARFRFEVPRVPAQRSGSAAPTHAAA